MNPFEKVDELIEMKAQEAIDMGWLNNHIQLCTFIGWFSEAANCWGEIEDWEMTLKLYGYDIALQNYCWKLVEKGAFYTWNWDLSGQSVHLYTEEDQRKLDEYWENR